MRVLLTALLLVTNFIALSPASADDSLYRDLGGKEGITRIVDAEMVRHLANPRIKAQFDDTNIDRLKGKIVIFICDISGGPCKYTGPDLHTVHKGMHLTEADFNSFVEDMQSAMDELGVPFSTQNRLLARLAPFERDVVTK